MQAFQLRLTEFDNVARRNIQGLPSLSVGQRQHYPFTLPRKTNEIKHPRMVIPRQVHEHEDTLY